VINEFWHVLDPGQLAFGYVEEYVKFSRDCIGCPGVGGWLGRFRLIISGLQDFGVTEVSQYSLGRNSAFCVLYGSLFG
jgi:hypothetical protein